MDLKKLHDEAIAAAVVAAKAENDRLPPENSRGFDCGFAWVVAPDAKLNTPDGKALAALGFQKIWKPQIGVYLWMTGHHSTQSVSVHEAAARAYVEAMKPSGIRMYVGSRLD